MAYEGKEIFTNERDIESPSSPSDNSLENEGTSADAQDMLRIGRKQLFRRDFHMISVFGFATLVNVSWEVVLLIAQVALLNGGIAGMIWGSLGVVIAYIPLLATMAQMASMAPTTGGQYHWVSEFAPRSLQKFLSYMVGWTAALGWQAGVGSAAYLAAETIQGVIVMNNANYEPKRWQATLLIVAIIAFSTLVCTVFAKHLHHLTKLMLLIHLGGFVGIMVTLLVLSPKTPSKIVWTEFQNGGDWSSLGGSIVIGTALGIFMIVGPDAAVHLAEEVSDASLNVPRAMFWTTTFNGLLGFVMTIVLGYTLTDLDAALSDPTGYPFLWVFRNATGSVPAATGLSMLLVILLFCATIAILSTAARQSWAFARDGGLPFSNFFSKVVRVSNHEVPLNSILLSTSFTILVSLINLGSSYAFYSIVGCCITAISTSYFISISCFVIKQLRGEELPPARWTVPRWLGYPLNFLALAFVLYSIIVANFPGYNHPTLQEMNWSEIVYGFVILLALSMYIFHGRFFYEGPSEYMRKRGIKA